MTRFPPFTAEQSLGSSLVAYRKLKTSTKPHTVKPFSTNDAHVDDPEPGKYQLAACTRAVHFGHKPGVPTKYCYLRLRDSQQRTRDSLSFSRGFPAASSDIKISASLPYLTISRRRMRRQKEQALPKIGLTLLKMPFRVIIS